MNTICKLCGRVDDPESVKLDMILYGESFLEIIVCAECLGEEE